MREILFRAQTGFERKWVEGYYSKEPGYDGFVDVIVQDTGEWVEVYPETLCEFAGRRDKNGVKIFEGDITRADNGHIGYVVFRDGSFVKVCSCHNSVNTFYGDNETVIGNIYDNPELLEEVK